MHFMIDINSESYVGPEATIELTLPPHFQLVDGVASCTLSNP